jgi:lipopolysaccharide biosynthesis glycosyltransferase
MAMAEVDARPIDIALVFDDNFWAPAYAVMRSVALHTRFRKDLRFHLVHQLLTREHIADLQRIEEEFGAQLIWHNLAQVHWFEEMVRELPGYYRISKVTYARLILDRLLGASVERVIYLDCDVMVRDGIEALWEADLGGEPIGAIRDAGAPLESFEVDHRHRTGFDPADLWFNSGVMVIDIARWREFEVVESVAEMVSEGTAQNVFLDQDILNIIFRRKWRELPAKWNFQSPRHSHEPLSPSLLHYTGEHKPWALYGPCAYRRIYRRIMTNELFYRYLRYRLKQRLPKPFRRS